MTTQESAGSLPGVRVGQVWQERHPKKDKPARSIRVYGLGLGDVYCTVVGEEPVRDHSLPREGWEDRWVLVSEGGIDA